MSEFKWVWTDELAAEYGEFYRKRQGTDLSMWGKDILQAFKESKQPKPEWEIIEFVGFKNQENPFNRWHKIKDNAYQTCAGAVIFTLNDMINGSNGNVINGRVLINSVKRLTDGEVFTIKDYCLQGEIKRFNYSEWSKNITAVFESGKLGCEMYLSDLKKVEQPKPLLITEDGVSKYKGDECYYWDSKSDHGIGRWYSLPDPVEVTNPPTDLSGYKYFSTKKAAEEYILLNKPVLSLNDLLSVWGDGTYEGEVNFFKEAPLFKKFQQLAKSKL